METIITILKSIKPNVDYATASDLVDAGILDSLSIIALVVELENEFDIEISPVDLIPANFNTVAALWDMVCRLQG